MTGWKLVPIDATEEQAQIAFDTGDYHDTNKTMFRDAYRIMVEAAPSPPEDPRAAALAEEAKRPGQEGAMARLLQVCDFDQVRGWINAELARGTGPSDRFEVITATAANMLVLAALSVQTKHTRALAQLLGRVSERAHTQLGVVLAERGPDVLTPQRLRIITEDRE